MRFNFIVIIFDIFDYYSLFIIAEMYRDDAILMGSVRFLEMFRTFAQLVLQSFRGFNFCFMTFARCYTLIDDFYKNFFISCFTEEKVMLTNRCSWSVVRLGPFVNVLIFPNKDSSPLIRLLRKLLREYKIHHRRKTSGSIELIAFRFLRLCALYITFRPSTERF